MQKAKTNRSAAKRFRATKKKGFKRGHAFTGHLKTAKSAKRRRNLRKAAIASERDERTIRRLLPYA